MKLEITEEQNKKIHEWMETLIPRIKEIQPENMRKMGDVFGHPYYGACDGGLTYEVTPTGIGVVIKVREYFTQEVLDITDYENW